MKTYVYICEKLIASLAHELREYCRKAKALLNYISEKSFNSYSAGNEINNYDRVSSEWTFSGGIFIFQA